MDTLYYSKYCKYCENVLLFIAKKQLINRLSCINIDRRSVDPYTGQITIYLENGQKMPLPPMVHRVPTLVLALNHHAIEGNDIISHFEPNVKHIEEQSLMDSGGEPASYDLSSGGSNYTYTDGRSPENSKYISADHNIRPIHAPPEDYRPNKLSAEITIETLEKERNSIL
jgi:hypothetical protein